MKLLILAGLVGLTALTPAHAANRWTAVPLNFEKGGLSAVATVGDSETWAVGSDIAAHQPVALRERDGNWESVAPPSSVGHLYGVSGRAPDQVWVVGTGGTALFDGARWNAFESTAASLADVAAAPDGQAWAVGEAETAGELQHWDPARRTWQRQQVPVGDGKSTLAGVSVRAADDVWVVGSNAADGTALALHWDGGKWVRTPVAGEGVQLHDVQHLAADDVWAVGRVVTADGDKPFLVHWDGRQWTVADAPTEKGWPASVSAVDGGLVAAGAEVDVPYLLRFENGKWRRDEVPAFSPETGGLSDVAGRGAALTVTGAINRGDPEGDQQPVAPYLGSTGQL
ncbi:hypothetical protein ACPZ19_06385 [Amycolatopsis lurida]